jgi:hypothetical protein
MRCKRSLKGTTRAQYTTGELVSRGPIEALNVCRRAVTSGDNHLRKQAIYQ